MSLVKTLNSIIENGDNISNYLVKIENPENNFNVYLDIYRRSVQDLTTDYYGTTYIHPEQWFEDVLDFIAMFDYKSNVSQVELTYLKGSNLVSNRSSFIQQNFATIDQAKSFFQELKNNEKIIILYSISKVVNYSIVGGNYKNCNQLWSIKYSTIDIDLELKRDIMLDKILKK